MVAYKKSLGQNFLQNAGAAKRIVEFLDLYEEDNILEIGPGKGALTGLLVDLPIQLMAVEIDSELSHGLWEKYSSHSNVIIVNQDFLKFDFDILGKEKWKLLGNLPYNVTSPILERVFDQSRKFSLAVFTVQKEVADRMTATPGSSEYSSLSVFTQCYTSAEKLLTLKPGSFFPAPKVSSAVVRLKFTKPPFRHPKTCQKFNKFVQNIFSFRRKTILNGLALSVKVSKSELGEEIESVGIEPSARPQSLSLENFVALYKKIKGLVDV